MKLNLDKVILGKDNEPLKAGTENLTLGEICCAVLNSRKTGDLDTDKVVARGQLIQQMRAGGELTVSDEMFKTLKTDLALLSIGAEDLAYIYKALTEN